MGKSHRTCSLNNIGGTLSVGGENLYELIKAQEVAKGYDWRPIQRYSIYSTSDFTVSINGDTDNIPVFANLPFSGEGEITSFILNTGGIEYSFVIEY